MCGVCACVCIDVCVGASRRVVVSESSMRTCRFVLGQVMDDSHERTTLMSSNKDKVAARRAIQEAQAERVRQRREREAQLEQLAVQVGASLASGRRALAEAEIAAGRALNVMVGEFGLGVREIQEWCAVELTAREIGRLRRAACEAVAQGDPP